jgi:hypothetical protein
MDRRLLRVALGWLVLVVGTAAASEPFGASPEPLLPNLRRHVTTLAAPEFQGRSGPGGQKTADYLVDAFKELGLEPLFDGQFTQPIPGREPGQTQGRNVGARLAGSDPELRDQCIILSAHFDHLGIINGKLYPGADDNASGVAMLLEAARCLSSAQAKPRRTILFVGFDLEEIGLFGSRYFVDHPPVPLEQIKLFFTADMIGRSLGGVCDSYVFAIGSEHSPAVRAWITQASAEKPLQVGLLGTDVVGTRSDYGPFRHHKIPYLFFSTGENPLYHRPGDTADTLDYPKLEACSRLILDVVRQAASADAMPAWTDAPDNPFSEAVTMRDVIRTFLDHRDELGIHPPQSLLLKRTLQSLDAIVERGSIRPGERSMLVRVAQIVLISVL